MYPAISFSLYEAVYFFSPKDRWWSYLVPSARWSFFTVMLMFCAFALKVIRHDEPNRLAAAPQYKWVIMLLLMYAIAWFYSVNPEGHTDALIYYFKLIIIITVAYKLIDTVKQLDFVLWGYLFGSWYISFLIFQTGRNSGNRVEGIGTVDAPDANGIAAAIAPSLVICFYYFWISRTWYQKLIFAFSGVFVANAIVLINSRASMLAVAFSMGFFVYYTFFSSLQRRFQKLTALIITILGLMGTLYIIDDVFLDRLSTMKSMEIDYEQQSAATRMLFWWSAIDVSMDYPFGQGYKGFDYHAPVYLPEGVDVGSSRNRSVHSTWFEALTEIGYPGLIAFLLLLLSCFRATRKCKKALIAKNDYNGYFKVIAIEAALLAFIIAMSFMNRFRAEVLYWLILYTMCAYNIYILKEAPQDEKSKQMNKVKLDEFAKDKVQAH